MATMYLSLPVRGAWIEMLSSMVCVVVTPSLPVRGAWIEIISRKVLWLYNIGRSPCGERGLKLESLYKSYSPECRSPCGERGLKFQGTRIITSRITVAPRAGSVD